MTWDSAAVSFGAGVSMLGASVDPATQLPVGVPVSTHVIVGWNFEGTTDDVLGTLDAAQRGLEDLVVRITAALVGTFRRG